MMIRRYGRPPEGARRYTLRRGVYAILPRDGALLMTYQAAPHSEVQLPGGGIDPGEDAIPALHREVFEETGWKISQPRRLGAFRRFTFMPEYDLWAEKLCILYVARPVISHGPPTEEGHTALWTTPIVGLSLLGNPGDRAMLKRYLANS